MLKSKRSAVMLFGCLMVAVGGLLARQPMRSRSWSARLMSADPVVAESARRAMVAGKAQYVPTLQEMLTNDGNDWEHAALVLRALEIVRELGPEASQASPQVVKLLGASQAHLREVAAQTLPAIQTPAATAVPALIQQLEHSPNVPALRALSEYGREGASAVPTLSKVLMQRDLAAEVRWNAARTIGKLRSPTGLDVLVDRLQDTEPTVREHAAEAIGDIGPEARQAAEALVAVLGDEFVKVRRDAVRSLGQIAPDAATIIPHVRRLLEDPEPIVREAAKQTLEQLQPKTTNIGT